jgi:hypothetical protein
MTPEELEAQQHRLLSFVEHLQRSGHSQRGIEAALREERGERQPRRRPDHGTERLLARFIPLRLRA